MQLCKSFARASGFFNHAPMYLNNASCHGDAVTLTASLRLGANVVIVMVMRININKICDVGR